jgi:hypothetical protein
VSSPVVSLNEEEGEAERLADLSVVFSGVSGGGEGGSGEVDLDVWRRRLRRTLISSTHAHMGVCLLWAFSLND